LSKAGGFKRLILLEKRKPRLFFGSVFSAIDFVEASRDVLPFLFGKKGAAHWDSKLFLDSLSLQKFRD